MLNSGFGTLADDSIDLYPEDLRADIDALNERIYPKLNNGVYRTGFAITQLAYEEAFVDVFAMLDELEARLENQGPYLFGDRLTEADVRLFVTLVRFDAAYNGLFKCNLRRLADYARLSRYVEQILAIPGIRGTVNIDHIKRDITRSRRSIPTLSFRLALSCRLSWHKGRTRCRQFQLTFLSSCSMALAPVATILRRLPMLGGQLTRCRLRFSKCAHPSSFGSGYQWFSVAGVTEDNRSERIRDARLSFDKMISSIIAGNGFIDKLDRVAFVGFSQGTIMALDAVASGRWPVGAVVGFSGRLASPLPLQPALETPILLVHGSADPVIPSTESSRAAATLDAFGVKVETLTLPGLPHTISAEGAARAGSFLAEAMAK